MQCASAGHTPCCSLWLESLARWEVYTGRRPRWATRAAPPDGGELCQGKPRRWRFTAASALTMTAERVALAALRPSTQAWQGPHSAIRYARDPSGHLNRDDPPPNCGSAAQAAPHYSAPAAKHRRKNASVAIRDRSSSCSCTSVLAPRPSRAPNSPSLLQ